MTQTMIDQLEKFIEERLKGIDQTEIESPDGWWETSGGADFGESVLSDLRAIIEQHKKLDGSSREESYDIVDRFLRTNLDDGSYSDYSSCLDDLYHMPTPQPNIIAELVKALEDDAYAASFQSMAGYRNALIAKVKGVIK